MTGAVCLTISLAIGNNPPMAIRQTWDPEQDPRDAGFAAALGALLLADLAPTPGMRILDLGCGDGTLTAQLAALGCTVVGVDNSPEQIQAALGRGLDARVMGGHALLFEQEFDAVISNAALHWMLLDAGAACGARGYHRCCAISAGNWTADYVRLHATRL